MRGKITRIYGSMPGIEKTEWAVVDIGLSPTKLVGVKKGAHKVGDLIDIPPQFLGPELEGTLTAFALELRLLGKIDSEEKLNLLGEVTRIAVNYNPAKNLDDKQQGYLVRIFELMIQFGDIVIYQDGVDYVLATDGNLSANDAYQLIELGHLIADFEWTRAHERDAMSGKLLSQNQKFGLASATMARVNQGTKTRELVKMHADRILHTRPDLKSKNSALARAILEDVKRNYTWEFDSLPKFDHIRRILSKLQK